MTPIRVSEASDTRRAPLRYIGGLTRKGRPGTPGLAMTLLANAPAPDDSELDAYWMPFTANRQFKAAPRMLVEADGMFYTTAEGRRILDGFSGMWCCNAGHCRKPIVAAIQRQAATMDYAPAFQMGHPLAFELANRIVELAPGKLEHVFFCNSGSEAVDSALKIALA